MQEKCRYYPLFLSYHSANKFHFDIALQPTPPPLNKGMYILLLATNLKAFNSRNMNPFGQKKKKKGDPAE